MAEEIVFLAAKCHKSHLKAQEEAALFSRNLLKLICAGATCKKAEQPPPLPAAGVQAFVQGPKGGGSERRDLQVRICRRRKRGKRQETQQALSASGVRGARGGSGPPGRTQPGRARPPLPAPAARPYGTPASAPGSRKTGFPGRGGQGGPRAGGSTGPATRAPAPNAQGNAPAPPGPGRRAGGRRPGSQRVWAGRAARRSPAGLAPRLVREGDKWGGGRRGGGHGLGRACTPRADSRRREASASAQPVGTLRLSQGGGRGGEEGPGGLRLLPSSRLPPRGARSPRSRAPEAAGLGRGREDGAGGAAGGSGSGQPPRAPERVQGSAVFRLPPDLTLGAQRPPGCTAVAQPSRRCQINEPTSGWVYSSAGKQPSGKGARAAPEVPARRRRPPGPGGRARRGPRGSALDAPLRSFR